MVHTIYVEKKDRFSEKPNLLLSELKTIYGINTLTKLRILHRYEISGISTELFNRVVATVLADPYTDNTYNNLPDDAEFNLCIQYLPGQFDQREDSLLQCLNLYEDASGVEVNVSLAFLLYGQMSDADKEKIKSAVMNPVDSRAIDCKINSLDNRHWKKAEPIQIYTGFKDLDDNKLEEFLIQQGFAMDLEDLKLCRDYFKSEDRDPFETELKMIDTYWSDHCRHTTFFTHLVDIDIHDKQVAAGFENYKKIRERLGITKPVTLMDIATIGSKYLKSIGLASKVDDSEEVNACTVVVDLEIEDKKDKEEYLLLFKNETHNHPTEIEPYGGASTCLGGCIRDPLSGRGYVYQAMRVTGAGNPLTPIKNTIPGKLPQRQIVTQAADGYSFYGNTIGVPAGLVEEIYHDGYTAKRMEVGAVLAAVPRKNVIRMTPQPKDVVILVGGKTGRDGCGGATGSSKSHSSDSLDVFGAEVQKGDPMEERKLLRLFRNPEFSKLIKRCNDFGAGGVSVAIGELADSLDIYLDRVPVKYRGLNGTEIAISESQERMAIVVHPDDANKAISLAKDENLEATVVATVTNTNRLRMIWQENIIVDLSREFLNTNGASKKAGVTVKDRKVLKTPQFSSFLDGMKAVSGDLNSCSQEGLSEIFDATAGGNTVLMPFGGQHQKTPIQAMVSEIPTENGRSKTCSVFSYGFNPFISEMDSFAGAYNAVVESIAKLYCVGPNVEDCYLSFQEYFPRLGGDSVRWGRPFAALLGALQAQLDFQVPSIGGKDSMSGSFEDLDVPPTLISFAVTTNNVDNIITPEFKSEDGHVYLLKTETKNQKVIPESFKENLQLLKDIAGRGELLSISTPTFGGVASAIFKMAVGNKKGFAYSDINLDMLFDYLPGSFVIETSKPQKSLLLLGRTTKDSYVTYKSEKISLSELLKTSEERLSPVFPINNSSSPKFVATQRQKISVPNIIKDVKPKVLIPIFPGTTGEYEAIRAFESVNAQPRTFVFKNKSQSEIIESITLLSNLISDTQILYLPAGSVLADQPDGAAKFVDLVFRNPIIDFEIQKLLDRGGLIGGVGTGFIALVKLGLLPFGKISDKDQIKVAFAENENSKHFSTMKTVKILTTDSPWLSEYKENTFETLPISGRYSRLICDEELLVKIKSAGQIASVFEGPQPAIEGLISPDGKIFGRLGLSDRSGPHLYKNIPQYNHRFTMFEGAVKYFK